tara:strand:+ start:221 stop:520 length:300 start_codon:yes stop_codon:yes gene_type:complete
VDRIDVIHGKGRKWNHEVTDILYGLHESVTTQDHPWFKGRSAEDLQNMRDINEKVETKKYDEYKTTNRNLWKTKKFVKNKGVSTKNISDYQLANDKIDQ